jgi:hypothetical protein
MRRSAVIALFTIVLFGGAGAASILDKFYNFGVCADYHSRTGFFNFGGDHIEEMDKRGFPDIGIEFGKRWPLSRRVRLQMSIAANYGSVTDDTLPAILLSDNTWQSTLLQISFFYGSLYADVQFPFHVAHEAQLFFHAGVGAHGGEAWESEILAADHAAHVTGDPFLEDHTILCGSLHGGLGFEFAFNDRFGLSVSYSLRYWQPISNPTRRDLFPAAAVDYYERFLSQGLEVTVLAKRQ